MEVRITKIKTIPQNINSKSTGALSVQSESITSFEPFLQVLTTFFLNNSASSLGGAFHRYIA